MRDAGSSTGSCAIVTSQSCAGAFSLLLSAMLHNSSHELRQGTRRARPELPAADSAHEKSAHRHAVGAGAQGARHRSGRGQGFPDLLAPDRARARLACARGEGIHFLHEEEVTRGWLLAAALAFPAHAQNATYAVRILTPETALKAAQAALKSCRDRGFQATVAVVDRMGMLQVLLRDRFAGPHTTDMASAKAYTAVSFRTNTTELAEASQPGRPASGIRHRPGVAAVGGGMMIEAGGTLLGAIGVSGAPGGKEDDLCAAAGIEAIREDIEL